MSGDGSAEFAGRAIKAAMTGGMSGDVGAEVAAVLAAAKAESEIHGQMKHITAEMVRGDQPLEEKEELIADLRARLALTEVERDEALAKVARLDAEFQQLAEESRADAAVLAERACPDYTPHAEQARAALGESKESAS